VFKRIRHLVVYVVALALTSQLAIVLSIVLKAAQAVRGRHRREPGTAMRCRRSRWPMLAASLVSVLYAAGARRAAGASSASGRRPRSSRWPGLARVALGLDAPTDVLLGAVIGVTIPLLAFRWFAPNEVFPVTYRRGRTAHLDVGGARGQAIRRALQDQLGLEIEEVEAVRAGRVGRVDPAADQGQGRPGDGPVRQAVRPQPPALGPLVQARPGAAVWPAGG
jgi:hypothetical protein